MPDRILLISEKGHLYLDRDKDINTEFGIITSKQLKKAKVGSVIKTHTGNKFFVADATYPDLIRKITRLPQIIMLKDMGSIVVYLGIKSTSKVLDAGTGSGVAACIFGSVANQGSVLTYEMRKDFIKVAKKNIELFGLKNVKIINSDIREGPKQKNFDAALIDIPDPWNALKNVFPSLKPGARIATYSPSIIQIEKTLRSLPQGLRVERLIQANEIDWKVDVERDILRPESSSIVHTAFLLFMRKVGR